MLRTIKKLGLFLFVGCVSINTFASECSNVYDNETNYYENEGNLVFKARGSLVSVDGKPKSQPSSTVANSVGVGNFVNRYNYGGDASISMFFSSNLAAELSVGINVLRPKSTFLTNVANNNGNTSTGLSRKRDLFFIPFTVLGQYHIAPFGAIRPYVGAGGHYTYMITRSKSFRIKNGLGPVLQAGVDFYAKDDTLINLDIRQYFLTSKVHYKRSLVNSDAVSSKIKMNPLVVSIGIGFKF
ncbi:MAG: OmpW family outer membrane protein [Candidatus Rickettsia vulgarisii]